MEKSDNLDFDDEPEEMGVYDLRGNGTFFGGGIMRPPIGSPATSIEEISRWGKDSAELRKQEMVIRAQVDKINETGS